MSTRPLLNQREAATACGVSRTTIRRRREAGDLPGAVQDPQRGWLIPVEDLLAAGFRLNAPAGPDPEPTAATPAGTGDVVPDADRDDIAGLRAELDRLRHEHALAVAEAENGRRVAEVEAAHLRAQLAARAEHITDLQQALRALTAGQERAVLRPAPSVPGQAHPAGPAPEPVPPTAPAPAPAPGPGPGTGGEAVERRRWWRRA
ncbi:helix-turn-helix domain-containing protein [Streptomyces sp. NPDC008125]|uniref:helix-turn-helix transcriptional regulator n=1 Tax=Streptomyces sp. NPDC008125 TaxID=3364811 RepID=UPI0036ED27A8